MNPRAPRRDVQGILLLDKPVNITSNAALQTVKRLYQARKAGHTGSLDPLASGLLPICLGEATKVSGFLLDTDKHYRALCRLGVTTRTGDAEGDILETRTPRVFTHAQITAVLAGFLGKTDQMPPMHSALKQNGQPLYKLAHRGLSVPRATRPVHIYRLGLVRYQDDLLELDIHCSKGTYIRVLAEDIGARLGCGAHLAALRRTGLGGFDQADSVSLERLHAVAAQGQTVLDGLLLPMQTALAHWPQVSLTDDATHYLCQGQAVFVPRMEHSGWVALYAQDKRFLGMGIVQDDGRVAPKRLLNQV